MKNANINAVKPNVIKNAVKPNVIKNAEKFVLFAIINVKINVNIVNAQNYVMKFAINQFAMKDAKKY